MKKISLLFFLLFINFTSFSQITGTETTWTTAYCNEEIGLMYKAGTVALNQRISTTAGTGTLQPAPITISGIGSNVAIRKVYLWFSIIGQIAPTTTYSNLTLKNPSGANLAISNITCVSNSSNLGYNNASGWLGTAGTNFGSGLTLNYRAEVTLTGTLFNGNYTINGFPTILSTNPDVDVTGATLMIIYKDISSCVKGSLVIQDTYMKNGAGYAGQSVSSLICFPMPTINSTITRFFNVVDDETSNNSYTVFSPYNAGLTPIPFNGDMMNFISITVPFTDPNGNLPTWDFADNTGSGNLDFTSFCSMRGAYWQDNSIVPINASFTVPYYNCEVYPVTMNGSASTGTINQHIWTVLETNSAGVPISGPADWFGNWINGAPLASESIPTQANGGPTLVCGKFYRIKLVCINACQDWVETTRLIAYSCNPTLNFSGSTSTICGRNSGHLSVSSGPGTYNLKWIKNSPTGQQTIIYNGAIADVVVSPTVTTTYVCVLTNTVTGCSSTANYTITVIPDMNSSFGIATITTDPNWFTITATINDQSASSVAGFGYSWEIKEISTDGLNTLNFTIINPSVWQGIPLNTATTFRGFDDFYVNYIGNVTSIPSSVNAGRFLYGHHYVITRKTWNNFCPVSTSIFDLNGVTRAHINSSNIISSTSVEDHEYMKFATFDEGLMISPNPSNGIFNISSLNSDIASVEIYDMAGTKLRVNISNTDSKTATFDLTGNAKGIYLVHVVSEGNVIIKKITLN